MKWNKKGFIFKPNGELEWMNSHTTPIAAIAIDNYIRIFFSSRSRADKDGNYISYTSFIDVEKDNPECITYINDKPLIDLGGPGYFDEFGIMVAKPVSYENEIYLYYMGWQRLSKHTAPYQVTLGLAISNDKGFSFKKVSQGPIIGIDKIDPISIGNVSVIIDDGKWRMWYTSYTRWVFGGLKPTPEYSIKYAESNDGIDWIKTNQTAIKEDCTGGVATPSVLKIDGIYHMWFGYRPPYNTAGEIHGYNIGYAKSDDGNNWIRNDNDSGIITSQEGWDSKMVCYPHVIKVENRILMFYCGNDFGKEGFGYAVLQEE